eukprot:tig00000704_g3348.t1
MNRVVLAKALALFEDVLTRKLVESPAFRSLVHKSSAKMEEIAAKSVKAPLEAPGAARVVDAVKQELERTFKRRGL